MLPPAIAGLASHLEEGNELCVSYTYFVQSQTTREETLKSKVEERNRKAELVRQNKMKIVQEGGDMVPESA